MRSRGVTVHERSSCGVPSPLRVPHASCHQDMEAKHTTEAKDLKARLSAAEQALEELKKTQAKAEADQEKKEAEEREVRKQVRTASV